MIPDAPNRAKPLLGKTAMITGSSTGIGSAIALELAEQGANIILHGRSNSEAMQAIKTKLAALDADCHCLLEDFSTNPDWNAFVDKAWKWKSGFDFWINNAGGDVLTGKNAQQSLDEKLELLWQVDVKATLMLSRRAGELMAETLGPPGEKVILNMGWDQAWQGMAGESGELFSTTKGAIMSMTKSLAQSFAPQVRVNCIAPGWIKTDWGEQSSDYWDNRAKNESLMNRWGTPADVANVAAFLCSRSASFISGQIVPVNGGFNYDSSER